MPDYKPLRDVAMPFFDKAEARYLHRLLLAAPERLGTDFDKDFWATGRSSRTPFLCHAIERADPDYRLNWHSEKGDTLRKLLRWIDAQIGEKRSLASYMLGLERHYLSPEQANDLYLYRLEWLRQMTAKIEALL